MPLLSYNSKIAKFLEPLKDQLFLQEVGGETKQAAVAGTSV